MTGAEDKFFQLLRLAVGSSADIPHVEKGEWGEVYEMARRQSLLGLAFDGVQAMNDAAKEVGLPVEMDVDLLMRWMGKCKQIERRNAQLDKAVAKASAWFQKKGFRTCLLKGQGNALMYPHPAHRTPGDIDLWVSGRPSEVIRFVHSIAPQEKASYHHIDFPDMDGIPVEVHYRPCYMQNPLHNHRLQSFFRRQADEQFARQVGIGGEAVAVPTTAFNVVYQLVHIFNHLFQEGIGLRQIVDYYLVIDNWHADLSNRTDLAAIQHRLKYLGLWQFAGAVMYVLREVLALSEDKMVVPADARRGRMLLDEIMRGGNFGQYDERHAFGHGAVGHNLQRLSRDWRLVWHYPAEALSEPVFRIWHYWWRLRHR